MARAIDSGALTEPTFYILLSLHQPMHGYAIMQNVQEITDGRVAIGAGTLYGAINLLIEKGWIEALHNQPSDRKKEYRITQQGKQAFLQEVNRLQALLANAQNVINTANTKEA